MQIGIFAKTFQRPNLEATLDAVRSHGIDCVQFNFSCAGLPTLPEALDPDRCVQIRKAHEARGIRMAAVSGTFNLIHPNVEERRRGFWRLRTLAFACRWLGTSVITLSTGTRNATDLWSAHPENSSQGAWADLVDAMKEIVRIAQETEITAAFEPEVSNVVDTARKARRLLDEIGSTRLKVVLDGANLFRAGDLPRMREILEETFELLGKDIILAHAKDLRRDGEAGDVPAGKGLLDYDLYLRLFQACGYDGPIVLHGLPEADVERAVAFLKDKLQVLEASGSS